MYVWSGFGDLHDVTYKNTVQYGLESAAAKLCNTGKVQSQRQSLRKSKNRQPPNCSLFILQSFGSPFQTMQSSNPTPTPPPDTHTSNLLAIFHVHRYFNFWNLIPVLTTLYNNSLLILHKQKKKRI